MRPIVPRKGRESDFRYEGSGTCFSPKIGGSLSWSSWHFLGPILSATRRSPGNQLPYRKSIYEVRPLIRVSDTEAFCPLINALFNAVLLVGEQTLLQNSVRDRFLRSRDKALEKEALTKIRSFLSPKASIWFEVYETPDCQYEHDVIVVDEGLFLLLRRRLRRQSSRSGTQTKRSYDLETRFRADKGIQKAFEQGNRIVRKLKAGKAVPLYDARRREVGRLLPDHTKTTYWCLA